VISASTRQLHLEGGFGFLTLPPAPPHLSEMVGFRLLIVFVDRTYPLAKRRSIDLGRPDRRGSTIQSQKRRATNRDASLEISTHLDAIVPRTFPETSADRLSAKEATRDPLPRLRKRDRGISRKRNRRSRLSRGQREERQDREREREREREEGDTQLAERAGKLFAYTDVGEYSRPLVWRERDGEGAGMHISCDFNVSPLALRSANTR